MLKHAKYRTPEKAQAVIRAARRDDRGTTWIAAFLHISDVALRKIETGETKELRETTARRVKALDKKLSQNGEAS